MKSKPDETNLFDQYMKNVHQTMTEINTRAINCLDEKDIERGLEILAEFDFPFEVFQNFPAISKFNLMLVSSNKRNKEFLRSYFHTAKLTFGQEFNSYLEFNYIRETRFKKGSRTLLYIPSWSFQKIEKLYNLRNPSTTFLFNLLNRVFESKTYISATDENESRICLHITSLMFLVQHYGEDAVYDVLTKSLEEETFCSAIEVEMLIKDWAHFKDYPLQWALEIIKESTQNNEE